MMGTDELGKFWTAADLDGELPFWLTEATSHEDLERALEATTAVLYALQIVMDPSGKEDGEARIATAVALARDHIQKGHQERSAAQRILDAGAAVTRFLRETAP